MYIKLSGTSDDTETRKKFMRKLILTATLILGMVCLAQADPKIFLPEISYDFGHVPQNSTLTHDYWIKNIGTDTLKIIRVKPG